MNSLMIAGIIALAIAVFAVITRSKNTESETNTVYFIKMTIIAFVCTYFGMTYLIAPVCPEITVGEPDF